MKSKGFTLIELLVVIAIVSLLSSAVLASLNTARWKAREIKRVSDLRQIQRALELYYHDNGSYPSSGLLYRGECTNYGAYTPSQVIPGLVPAYLSQFPSDPATNATPGSCYLYVSNGADYALLDHIITDPGFDYNHQKAFLDPARDSGVNGCVIDGTTFWSWKVYSPGGVCW